MNIYKIEDFLNFLIDKAYPGYICCIYDNKLNKVYKIKGGYTSYESNKVQMEFDTFFDLASLTKVVGTTMLTCRYIDKGILNLGDKIGDFFDSIYYKDVTIEQLLIHTSGFDSHIMLEREVNDCNNIVNYLLNQKPDYKSGECVHYSCLGFIILGKILEKIGNKGLDELFAIDVFSPLKMYNTMFNPDKDYIFASTEKLLNGEFALSGIVHDENARFMQGVAGNAGLFSTGDDLIKFIKMLLKRNETFLSLEMYNKISQCMTKTCNKRALGFDLNDDNTAYFGKKASMSSYGHTGFTGTSIVIDPKKERGVVLLTNRVHPSRKNNLLIKKRAQFHDLVFS